MTYASFGPFLYSSLLATASSLFCGLLIFPKSASFTSAEAVIDVLQHSEELLQSTIEGRCRKQGISVLKSKAEALPIAFAEGVFEVSYARLRVDELQPLLGVARRMVSVFSSGLAPSTQVVAEDERVGEAMPDLVEAINDSFALLRSTIDYCYLDSRTGQSIVLADLLRQRDRLLKAQHRFRYVIQQQLNHHSLHKGVDEDRRRAFFRISYRWTSLLQVVRDAERALQVGEKLLEERRNKKRILLPKPDRRNLLRGQRSTGIGEVFVAGASLSAT